MHQKAAVSYLVRGEGELAQVLLYRKLTGALAGFLIGPGGRRDEDETSRDTAVREAREETGLVIQPEHVEELGTLVYHFTGADKAIRPSYVVMVSRVRVWSGSIEARPGNGLQEPHWHLVSRLPKGLPPGDPLWLPALLRGRRVGGSITYFRNAERVLAHTVWTED